MVVLIARNSGDTLVDDVSEADGVVLEESSDGILFLLAKVVLVSF